MKYVNTVLLTFQLLVRVICLWLYDPIYYAVIQTFNACSATELWTVSPPGQLPCREQVIIIHVMCTTLVQVSGASVVVPLTARASVYHSNH